MPIEWLKLYCKLFGHIPKGPKYEIADDSSQTGLEPFIYQCSRCRQEIRFNKKYPNGWVDVGIFNAKAE
jgi:hypothetical protein